MSRRSERIIILKEFFYSEMIKRGLKPYTFAEKSEPPKVDKGSLHRFLKGPPRANTSFNFVADLLQKLGLPFAVLDTLNLNGRTDDKSV